MVQEVADYQLLETIGSGTFGKVKLGRHIPTGELVAIKILHKNKITSEADKVRVDREISILRKVRHPNIIQLLEIIQTPSHYFIVTQYAQGGELFKYIVQNKRLTQEQSSRMIQQMLNVLEYLHSLGIAHRDLKPENLLLDRQLNIKVIDFGLGNIYAQGQKLSTACGSPSYAPPQMLSGQPYNGLLSDIWSCGIILYAMCCGYLPFQDPTTSELYRKIRQGKYVLPDFCSSQLGSFLQRVLNTIPGMRLSIQKMRQHPFCKNNYIIVVKGMIAGISCIPVKSQIAKQVSKLLKSSQSQIEQYVSKGKHNSETACYYLLLQKQLQNQGKQLLDYYIQKQSFIHRYQNIEQIQKIISRIPRITIDQSRTTQKKNKQKKNQSYEAEKTEKKSKSCQRKSNYGERKPLLQKYKF